MRHIEATASPSPHPLAVLLTLFNIFRPDPFCRSFVFSPPPLVGPIPVWGYVYHAVYSCLAVVRLAVVRLLLTGILLKTTPGYAWLSPVSVFLRIFSYKSAAVLSGCIAKVPRTVPEIIDLIFAKTSPKRSFCMTENERFGLVFVETGSINSGTGLGGRGGGLLPLAACMGLPTPIGVTG